MTQRSVRFALAVLVAGATLLGAGVPATVRGAQGTTAIGPGNAHTVAWKAQASGTGSALFAVSCFDALRCKAVGADGTLLYTKNGGSRWRPQANPLAGSSTVLYRIACAGRATCYVIGRPNILLVTHNGGVTWSEHRLVLPGVGTDLTDSACVSGQVFDLRARPALCRLGLLDLACLDASTCYVVATTRIQGEFGDLAAAVFLTTDGGATWVRQRIPAGAPCWGDCGPPHTTVTYPLTWISCGPGQLCRAGGATFLGSHPGWASLTIKVGKPGASWVPVDAAYTHGYGPAPDSAVCPTVTRCYGVFTTGPFDPGNAIMLSTDGGSTWTGLNGGTPKLRNALACPGAGTCYSVGNQGTITAASNGGPFLAQRSGTSHDLYGVTCVGATTCIAVGNKGTIVGTVAASR